MASVPAEAHDPGFPPIPISFKIIRQMSAHLSEGLTPSACTPSELPPPTPLASSPSTSCPHKCFHRYRNPCTRILSPITKYQNPKNRDFFPVRLKASSHALPPGFHHPASPTALPRTFAVSAQAFLARRPSKQKRPFAQAIIVKVNTIPARHVLFILPRPKSAALPQPLTPRFRHLLLFKVLFPYT